MREPGVFTAFVDRRAFLDKVVLSVSGERCKRSACDASLLSRSDRPTAGRYSNYSRAERGILCWTGNPYEFRYGTTRLKKIIPPMMLVVRSDLVPITTQEIATVAQALCKEGWQEKISQVELTFDLSGLSVEWFVPRIFTSARQFRTVGKGPGNQTHYVGAPKSPWQLRIYEKAPGITRYEFILRRAFLKRNEINTLRDLDRLREINLMSFVALNEVNETVVKSLRKALRDEFRKRILDHWFRDYKPRDFVAILTKCLPKPPGDLVRALPINSRLHSMQSRLVYAWEPGIRRVESCSPQTQCRGGNCASSDAKEHVVGQEE